ncbi:MAG TPA: M28 family peptidase [Gemmatimonadales bacterium]|nr:M28 family peptidase [Gemmatimonadales bacterium]
MIVTSLLLCAALLQQDSLAPMERRERTDLQFLAADAREGRGVGTKGLQDAGAYIAAAFKRAGLRPGGDSGTYFQRFFIPADAPAVLHTAFGGTPVRNVVGYVPGSSPALAGEVVVIGAHYDHLGLGGFGSLDPDSTGRVHNGADDNGSGTTALLELARRLGTTKPARTIVLVAFTGEELGDLGSDYYVKHSPHGPIDSVYVMLNMDMVGRMKNDRLIVLGAATATEFAALLDSLNGSQFDLRASGDGWGPSDHASFYGAHRPVLHFFTDLHEDYHRTTDDWQKIDFPDLARVTTFVERVAWTLANRPGALTFVNAPPPVVSTTGGGYGAYLGTIPDMSGSPGGVRITGVRAASPAEKAGLAGGDVITAIGDKIVANLYDMTDALRAHQAGDSVVIVVKRGEQTLRLNAVLGKRP